MAEFEKLQELWQHQPQPPMAAVDMAALKRALGTFGQRQQWINIAKLVMVAAVMAFELVRLHRSPWGFVGLAIVAAAAAVLLTTEWRNQRAIARLDFTAPSAAFVRSAIDLLMGQREPFRKYYWPFLLSIVVAVNLMIGTAIDTLFSLPHLGLMIFVSICPFIGYEFGKRVRFKRFETECRPLVDRLIVLLAALEEKSE